MNILSNMLGMEEMQWVFLWKKLSARDPQVFLPFMMIVCDVLKDFACHICECIKLNDLNAITW